MSENDIINLAQKRENAAMEYLLEKYKPLVRQKTRKLFLIDGDKDDLIQEGMIGLFKAVRDYQVGKDAIRWNKDRSEFHIFQRAMEITRSLRIFRRFFKKDRLHA